VALRVRVTVSPSLLQTKLRMNVLEDGPSMMKNPVNEKGIIYALNGASRLPELHVALGCLESSLPDDIAVRIECQGCGTRNDVLGSTLSSAFADRIDVVPEGDIADKLERKWTLTKAVAAWSSPFDRNCDYGH